ncbi:hypothetical protein MHM87_15525 [Alteromonas sp. Cnat3-28]|uniref:hypothetical protein n=1 Tax=Alteromonas sp. Cnat3-28 TaxID=2917729 RepID=UPI001EF4DD6C|nr:hypothetical protein [Alteromonas sp. Cnat3-28]MCG7646990.1 hypothetical protein [Alteromonas sp. Cnat3-28]
MRFTLLLLLVISFYSNASDEITIHIGETSYSINDSDKMLTNTELEIELSKIEFSSVTLDIDYCAEPSLIAEAYSAIANSKPSVSNIQLKAGGSSEETKCKNV